MCWYLDIQTTHRIHAWNIYFHFIDKNPTIHVGNYPSVDRILWDKKINLLFNPVTKPLGFQQSQVTPEQKSRTQIDIRQRYRGCTWHTRLTSEFERNQHQRSTLRPCYGFFYDVKMKLKRWRVFPKTIKKGNRNKMHGFKMDWQNQLYINICIY